MLGAGFSGEWRSFCLAATTADSPILLPLRLPGKSTVVKVGCLPYSHRRGCSFGWRVRDAHVSIYLPLLLQQMRIIHQAAWSSTEIESFRQLVFDNILSGLRKVIESMEEYGLELDEKNQVRPPADPAPVIN